jgi:hypothetical protein
VSKERREIVVIEGLEDITVCVVDLVGVSSLRCGYEERVIWLRLITGCRIQEDWTYFCPTIIEL